MPEVTNMLNYLQLPDYANSHLFSDEHNNQVLKELNDLINDLIQPIINKGKKIGNLYKH